MTQKVGRPQKGEDEARSARIAFRVTEDERAQIEARAVAAGVTVSNYARAVVLTGAPPAPPRHAADAAAISELNRVGVNLWQIAKHLNFGGGIPADLHDAIAEVRAAVEKLAGDE